MVTFGEEFDPSLPVVLALGPMGWTPSLNFPLKLKDAFGNVPVFFGARDDLTPLEIEVRLKKYKLVPKVDVVKEGVLLNGFVSEMQQLLAKLDNEHGAAWVDIQLVATNPNSLSEELLTLGDRYSNPVEVPVQMWDEEKCTMFVSVYKKLARFEIPLDCNRSEAIKDEKVTCKDRFKILSNDFFLTPDNHVVDKTAPDFNYLFWMLSRVKDDDENEDAGCFIW